MNLGDLYHMRGMEEVQALLQTGPDTDSEDRILDDGIYDITGIPFVQLSGMYFSKKTQERWKNVIDIPKARMIHREKAWKRWFTLVVRRFTQTHPEYVIAHGYATDASFLLASRPPKIGISRAPWNYDEHEPQTPFKHTGSWFNYGCSNILTNCPKDILILAEND